MMGISKIFGDIANLLTKGGMSSAAVSMPETKVNPRRISGIVGQEAQVQINRIYGKVDGMEVFLSLPEVFFPIDFIASRIAGAHFELRKSKDDSIVWCAGRARESQEASRLLDNPNWMQSFKEFTYSHFVYKLANGNAFIRAAMSSDLFDENTEKWKWCKALWTIPMSRLTLDICSRGYLIDLYGCEDRDDVINGYMLDGRTQIPSWQIFHDRDLYADTDGSKADVFMSPSRLFANERNIAILKRVYDARNTIYDKCGALGIITNRRKDDTGSVAMKPEDKKEMEDYYNSNYGTGAGKSPTLVTNADVDFLKTGADISQLQPFEETLADAIVIAGLYGIPPVLVPRKDQSTFSNQATAEKAVYTSVIIPMCKNFCESLTRLLGLKDYYIWCNFDDVDCLQQGRKEEEQVKKLVNDRCRQQFHDGLISFNDWRAQIHESALEGDEYNLLRWEMSEEQLARFEPLFALAPIDNKNQTDQNEEKDGSEESKHNDKDQ